MRLKRVVPLLLLLVGFSVISQIATAEFGYLALWRLPFQDSGTLQLFSDLTVAMVLITSWMVVDSRSSGVPALPYIAITIASGSFGPLLFLLHREWRLARKPAEAST